VYRTGEVIVCGELLVRYSPLYSLPVVCDMHSGSTNEQFILKRRKRNLVIQICALINHLNIKELHLQIHHSKLQKVITKIYILQRKKLVSCNIGEYLMSSFNDYVQKWWKNFNWFDAVHNGFKPLRWVVYFAYFNQSFFIFSILYII